MSKEWKEEEQGLSKTFQFKSFTEAWGFMSQVALIAEKAQHHPDWSNSYNKVKINLVTHDQGNSVTEKDRKLAAAIDEILS